MCWCDDGGDTVTFPLTTHRKFRTWGVTHLPSVQLDHVEMTVSGRVVRFWGGGGGVEW